MSAAQAAEFAVAILDGDDATADGILASLDRRGLATLARILAANVETEGAWLTEPRRRASLPTIITAVAEETGISETRITGRRRDAASIEARGLVYYLARAAGWSTTAIAKQLGRHHSTIAVTTRRMERNGHLLMVASEVAHRLTERDACVWVWTLSVKPSEVA